MRSYVLAWFVLAVLVDAANAGESLSSFDEIEFWVGSGTNSAAIIIDWDGHSNTDQSYAWGYHWEDSAHVADMLLDVISADSRLYTKFGNVAGLGAAVIGIGYDQNNDGLFGITDNSAFNPQGIAHGGLSDGETSTDAGDFYAEGWFLGYWHLGTASQNAFEENHWTSAQFGIDRLSLNNDSWISLAFTTDTLSTDEFAQNPIAAEAPLFADFDNDLDVDGADFLTWQSNFGLQSASHELGDANRDESVDSTDLRLWSADFGKASLPASLTNVPEPSSGQLALTLFYLFSCLGTGACGAGRTPRSSS